MGTECRLDRQLKNTLKKVEVIVKKLIDPDTGVNIHSVKTFLHTFPNVCTGTDLVAGVMKELHIESRSEALRIAQTIAKYGYVFVAQDSRLTVKDDATLHRFQNPQLWPTRERPATNGEYAIHLCKRVLVNKSRLNLEVHEMENFSRLQRQLAHKWDLVWVKAESTCKVDKRRSKAEQYIIESQERAFWNLHRPPPLSDYVLASDPLKFDAPTVTGKLPHEEAPYANLKRSASLGVLYEDKESLGEKSSESPSLSSRRRLDTPKAIESLIAHCSQYAKFDPMLPAADTATVWTSSDGDAPSPFAEMSASKKKSNVMSQVEKWSLSLDELVKDAEGVLVFLKYLEYEHSSENLRFWLACEEYKACPLKKLKEKSEQIFREYLSRNAFYQVNLDSRLIEDVRVGMHNPDHFTFHSAQAEIFRLMRCDSYPRFLKSESYRRLIEETAAASSKGIEKRGGILSILTTPPSKT